MKLTNEQIATRFGCTVEQVRAQHSRNAEQLRKMAADARRTGKTRYGTPDELDRMAERSERAAAA